LGTSVKAYIVYVKSGERVYFDEEIARADGAVVSDGAPLQEVDLGSGPFASIVASIMKADRGGEALAEDLRLFCETFVRAGRAHER